METRKITIIDSSTNNNVEIMTNATTFGELKAQAIAAGVNVANKDWMEGYTRTSPVDDDSLLPVDVKYVPKRGENAGQEIITNNLVYLLTNTNKKIDSGMLRSEMYEFIREHGLQQDIKDAFGKNYTLVSNGDLEEFLSDYMDNDECDECGCDCVHNESYTPDDLESGISNIIESLENVLKKLYTFKKKVYRHTGDDLIDDMLDSLKNDGLF